MNNREIIEELRERMEDNGHWSASDISGSSSSVSTYFGMCIRISDHSSNMVGIGSNLNVTSDGLGDVNVWDYENDLEVLVKKLVEFDRLFWLDGEEYWNEQGINEDDCDDKITHLKIKI